MSAFDPGKLANADASRVGGGEDSQPPDVGTYEVIIDGAEAFQSKKGNEVAKLDLRVNAGPDYGHAWTEIYGFGTDASYDFFLSVCERLAVDVSQVTNLEGLDGALKTAVGQSYMVYVVAPKNPAKWNRNSVFFQDGGPLAGSTQPPAPTPVGAAVSDDDSIPF